MSAGTSCEHVLAIAARRAALARLLLALAQAAHETDVDFLVSFALLQSDAVILAALEQDDADQGDRQEDMGAGKFAKKDEQFLELGRSDAVFGGHDGGKSADVCRVSRSDVQGWILFMYRTPEAQTRTGVSRAYVQRLAPSKSQLFSEPMTILDPRRQTCSVPITRSTAVYRAGLAPIVYT